MSENTATAATIAACISKVRDHLTMLTAEGASRDEIRNTIESILGVIDWANLYVDTTFTAMIAAMLHAEHERITRERGKRPDLAPDTTIAEVAAAISCEVDDEHAMHCACCRAKHDHDERQQIPVVVEDELGCTDDELSRRWRVAGDSLRCHQGEDKFRALLDAVATIAEVAA